MSEWLTPEQVDADYRRARLTVPLLLLVLGLVLAVQNLKTLAVIWQALT